MDGDCWGPRPRRRPVTVIGTLTSLAMMLNPGLINVSLKTCKTIRTFLSSRAMWRRVLQVVCHRYGVFPPSFPMKAMSTSQIKNAAMRPGRWGERIPYKYKCWPFYRLPWARSLMPVRIHIGEFVSLIPGGRFLVMTSRGGGLALPTVALWDLGVQGSDADSTVPKIVDSYPMNHDGSPVQCAVCAASKNSLTVLVVMRIGGGEHL